MIRSANDLETLEIDVIHTETVAKVIGKRAHLTSLFYYVDHTPYGEDYSFGKAFVYIRFAIKQYGTDIFHYLLTKSDLKGRYVYADDFLNLYKDEKYVPVMEGNGISWRKMS